MKRESVQVLFNLLFHIGIHQRSKNTYMSFFSKSWALFALLLVPLSSFDTYAIKYEPVTKQCDLFINLEYAAHFDLFFDEKACIFILPRTVENCTPIQLKNSARSVIRGNTLLLEAREADKVAFNGYFCQ